MKRKCLFALSIIPLLLGSCAILDSNKNDKQGGDQASESQSSSSSDSSSGHEETTTNTGSSDPTSGSGSSETTTDDSSSSSSSGGGGDLDVLYAECQKQHANKNASKLYDAIYDTIKKGKAGSYNQLWTTYCTAYVRADGKIFDYYSSITNYTPGGSAQGASYKKEGDSYNREHSIPKSWWGGATTNQGADPYIVVPTDGYVNNGRSNYTFGMVASASKTYSNSKLGSGKSEFGYTGTVFEPDDSVKGDFARIYFYAIAKYSAYGWTSGDGSRNFSGSQSKNLGLTDYAVKLYTYWNELDPVSEWEISVNNKVAPIQGNRNPFIDHPEYVNTLWGSHADATKYTH